MYSFLIARVPPESQSSRRCLPRPDLSRPASHRVAGGDARLALGAAVAGNGLLDSAALGPMSIPFGVFLMVAAGIAGMLVYQAPRSGASR